MSIIYNVISRRGDVLHLLAPDGEKREVQINSTYNCGVRAKYQVKFTGDILARNMYYRMNENSVWRSYPKGVLERRQARQRRCQKVSGLGTNPAKRINPYSY